MVTASRRAAAILESTSEEVSTEGVHGQGAEASAAAVTAPRGHLGVHLQRRDPRRYV